MTRTIACFCLYPWCGAWQHAWQALFMKCSDWMPAILVLVTLFLVVCTCWTSTQNMTFSPWPPDDFSTVFVMKCLQRFGQGDPSSPQLSWHFIHLLITMLHTPFESCIYLFVCPTGLWNLWGQILCFHLCFLTAWHILGTQHHEINFGSHTVTNVGDWVLNKCKRGE